MWRPSARRVAEEIQREEVAEAIGARPEKAARARVQVREMMLCASVRVPLAGGGFV